MMDTKAGALFATVKNVDTKEPGGEFEAVLSAPSMDRDGEIVDKGAFDPLPDEIPIHVDHRFTDTSAIVGRGAPFYEGDQLKVKGRYATTDEAQRVRTLVGEGMLTHMSVGYLDAKYEDKDGIPHLKSGELVEASFVSVAANRDALVTLSKAHSKVGARNSTKDSERLQTIHDLAVENGADCATKHAAGAATKAIAGTIEQRQDDLREALREAFPAEWLWIRGTFDDSVVYEVEVEDPDGSRRTATYQASYESTDDGFSFGDPVEVDIDEIVTPAEGADSPTPEPPADDPDPDGSASKAAAAPAVAQAQATIAAAELLLID